MLRIKKMTQEDLEFAVRLTDTMNWNLVEEDFEFMITLEPEGCFVLLSDAERIGVATTVGFGKVGWIGNVIVKEDYRRHGGGSLLVRHAIEYLTARGVETIGLYAYLDKIPFYTRQDFRYESGFVLLRGSGFSASTKFPLREATTDDIGQIIDFDALCFGSSRKKLLEPILLDPDNLCHIWIEGNRIKGYGAAKVYDDTAEVGPLVCGHESGRIAIGLVEMILGSLEGCEVSMCIPERENEILEMLRDYGFKEDFHVARMFRGSPVITDCIYIAESLERG